tara:strand:+ start:1050 stop:1211 length:162 start_codon:yes stop_codon:yes gene_type:complete
VEEIRIVKINATTIDKLLTFKKDLEPGKENFDSLNIFTLAIRRLLTIPVVAKI